MRSGRRLWRPIVVLAVGLVAGLALFLFAVFPALALQFLYRYTSLEDFNQGIFYHTALAWHDDGEVRLLPIGLGQPWLPGNNNGLPPRAGLAAVYADGYLYAIGGDSEFGQVHGDVFYSRVDTDVLTPSGRLSDWQTTTPLPTSAYPYGVYHHDAVAVTFTQTHNTYIYVFGGSQDENGADPIRVYDKALYAQVQSDGTLGPWNETTALPLPLYGMESVVLNNRIYLIGGANKDGVSSNMVYYAEPDSNSGWISTWVQTTAQLPSLGDGGYFEAAVSVNQGRIYVYGGSSGVYAPTYSIFVHFAQPLAWGDIVEWTFNDEFLPVNCFASEGADYESGLLLAIAGAWSCGTGCTPSGDVQVSLVDGLTGQTGHWFSTIAMDPPRFYHAVAQDADGWLYSVGGASGDFGDRMNDVDIAMPYGGGGLLGQDLPPATEAASVTLYAPDGTFTSPFLDIRPIQEPWYHATFTTLKWNTTITDPQAMTLTMSYRYYSPTLASWVPWSEPLPSNPGISVTTTYNFPPGTIGDYFQYRAFLSATTLISSPVATQTPVLNWVQVGVLSPPDLQAMSLTVICDTCPAIVPVDRPVQIEVKVLNKGSSLPLNNNFFIMVFYTTTEDYTPLPPAVPPGCENYNPPTVTCPLVLPQQAISYPEGQPPLAVRTTYTFTQPGAYWIVAYVDYNNTPRFSPPLYDVAEFLETNNIDRRLVWVGYRFIYLPMVTKNVQP